MERLCPRTRQPLPEVMRRLRRRKPNRARPRRRHPARPQVKPRTSTRALLGTEPGRCPGAGVRSGPRRMAGPEAGPAPRKPAVWEPSRHRAGIRATGKCAEPVPSREPGRAGSEPAPSRRRAGGRAVPVSINRGSDRTESRDREPGTGDRYPWNLLMGIGTGSGTGPGRDRFVHVAGASRPPRKKVC